MRKTSKILLTGVLLTLWATLGTQAANYQLDNNSISTALNASEGTEPDDDLFGNVFTAQVGANLITNVDFGVFTTTPGSSASVVLYRVTDPGGNPALGATRVYTQSFTPLVGDGTNAFLQAIPLTSPVIFNPGDRFLVAVLIKNVLAAPPNDVYPYLLDTSGVATGTYWDRSAPNTFNLDDLSQAKLISQPFVAGGFTPGAGHIFIRATGVPSAPVPCLQVIQQCAYPTNSPTCFTAGAPINFTGYVTNCGNLPLVNIVLTDSRTLLPPGLTDPGGAPLVQPVSLLPQQFVAFKGSFQPNLAETCAGSASNTITAAVQGAGDAVQTDGVAPTVTNSATAACSICTNSAITITKACASPIVTNVGSSLTVTGQVCNTGTITFDNVVVVDGQPGLPTSATNNIGSLAAGQCKPYSFTYTATSCDANHDTVTATGTSACGGTATATASADCFLCCPGISIETAVGCLQLGAVCSGTLSDYSTQATAVRGNLGDPTADNPAFCYFIRVRNTGHDPLTNIVIHDDQFGALGTFPGPLAVGGTITISNLRTNWAATTTNTSMVTAQCGGAHANGALVSATSNAVAVVLSGASVTCAMSISSPDDLDGNPNNAHVTIPGSGNHSVTFTTVITAGSLGLANVTIASPTLTGFGCPLPPPFSLSANSNFTFVCTASINCTSIPGGVLTNVAVVTAQIDTSTGVCANNAAGTPVLVTSTNSGPPCAVVLECSLNHPPVAKCKNIVVPADANCQGNGSVDDGSSDPDLGDTITIVQTPPGPYPQGTNNVTLCVTDSHGASNCCNATVTVMDTTPPDIQCPTNIIADTDPGQCSAVVSYTATATDGCVGGCTPLSQDFNTNPGGFIVLPSPPPPWIYSPVTGSWLVGQDTTLLGQIPTGSILQSPPIFVSCAGSGLLTLVHRFPFQLGPWGGGDVQVSLNNGPFMAVPPAGANFSAAGATGDVPNEAGPVGLMFVTNTAGLGVLHPGDVVQVRFVFSGNSNGVSPSQVAPDSGPLVPNWEITSVAITVASGSVSVPVVCDPPSGSTFPKGTNTVTCTASDAAGNTNACTFDVIVEDHEAPVTACRPGVNPSGKKIPVAGKNPSSGQNPDGYYQLLAKDNCDPDPAIYLGDTGSTFVAGPFHSGDVIKLTQSPGKTPSQDSAPDPIVAHVHLKGDGLLFAVDADGNISDAQPCLVPRPPK